VNQSIQSPDLDEDLYAVSDTAPDIKLEFMERRSRPEASVKLYVALWLPVAGALLAYAITQRSVWSAFIGIELLLVGLYTLAKL